MPHRFPLFRVAAAVAVAFTLMVLGAALRPVALPERHTDTPILTTVEIGFAQDMTAHHEQALRMTQRLDPDVDPNIRRLADQLADAQRTEIGTMLGWLRLADASPLSPQPMLWMHTESAGHDHAARTEPDTSTGMPGMATTAELDALAAARGREAEILFLRLMIRHHRGGVRMAVAAEALLTHGAVKEAARATLQSQSQEIGIMGVMLVQLGGQVPA